MRDRFSRQYQIAGIGPVARHRNEMLLHARYVAHAMVALPFYDYVPPEEDAVDHVFEVNDLLAREI